MLGTLVRSSDGAPVARVMAALEISVRIAPGTPVTGVLGFLAALTRSHAGRLRSECDDRDAFRLRPTRRSDETADFGLLRAALACACGATPDLGAAGWSTALYYDVADGTDVPNLVVACALGRRDPTAGVVGVTLSLALSDASAWADLFGRASALAEGWPGLWSWMTVGYRFCPLAYNGAYLAHLNIRRVAPRMPAADVGDTLGLHTSLWTTKLRTVSWATLVAPDLAARCEPARHEPDAAIDVTAIVGGGVSVRLRDDPDPGTMQRYVPRGLAAADALLRPIRARDGVTFLPPWDTDSTREWLDRWHDAPA